MNLTLELEEILRLERWAPRLPQYVAENRDSAVNLARLVARNYNEILGLYPVTPVIQIECRVSMVPRLVKR